MATFTLDVTITSFTSRAVTLSHTESQAIQEEPVPTSPCPWRLPLYLLGLAHSGHSLSGCQQACLNLLAYFTQHSVWKKACRFVAWVRILFIFQVKQ